MSLHPAAQNRFQVLSAKSWLDVEFNGEIYQAVTYEMTLATKVARNGMPYPEEYREICSDGARFHHIKNKFTTRRRKPWTK